MQENIKYLNGFGNFFESEALPGSLPKHRNNPQKCPRDLYAEQLSGSSFLAEPHENLRTWLYKIKPSVAHTPYQTYKKQHQIISSPFSEGPATPEQLRWDPRPTEKGKVNFVESLFTICGCGDIHAQAGCAVHLYSASESMTNVSFCNADGDLLIVPQTGTLLIQTEMGHLQVTPGEITVVPRGIKFSVHLKDKICSGYVCENFGAHFVLPYRGPIGANGLANERDFEYPVAYFEDSDQPMQVITKFDGGLWTCEYQGSVYNTVAWHGNYAPFKYNLDHFNTMNTVSFDHPDPSIFTVLTSPSPRRGTSNIDFVIFPPRWMVGEDTFRPPYYHRNIMSEYMGLIHGVYDAKPQGGDFSPGGGSLHNCMTAHGPDAEAFEKASNKELKPEYLGNTLAFMFETSMVLRPTKQALECSFRQKDYIEKSWGQLKKFF